MCNVDFSRSIGATESLMRDCHFEQPETLKDEIVFQIRILRDAERKREELAYGTPRGELSHNEAAESYNAPTGQICATTRYLDELLEQLRRLTA